jgi:hypothetical protein
MQVFRSAPAPSSPPEPDAEESDQDSNPVSLKIPQLCVEAINQALSSLDAPGETKDAQRSRGLLRPIPAQQHGNNSRESKEHNVENEVADRSLNSRMQPQRLEGRYNKERDPGRGCPA